VDDGWLEVKILAALFVLDEEGELGHTAFILSFLFDVIGEGLAFNVHQSVRGDIELYPDEWRLVVLLDIIWKIFSAY